MFVLLRIVDDTTTHPYSECEVGMELGEEATLADLINAATEMFTIEPKYLRLRCGTGTLTNNPRTQTLTSLGVHEGAVVHVEHIHFPRWITYLREVHDCQDPHRSIRERKERAQSAARLNDALLGSAFFNAYPQLATWRNGEHPRVLEFLDSLNVAIKMVVENGGEARAPKDIIVYNELSELIAKVEEVIRIKADMQEMRFNEAALTGSGIQRSTLLSDLGIGNGAELHVEHLYFPHWVNYKEIGLKLEELEKNDAENSRDAKRMGKEGVALMGMLEEAGFFLVVGYEDHNAWQRKYHPRVAAYADGVPEYMEKSVNAYFRQRHQQRTGTNSGYGFETGDKMGVGNSGFLAIVKSLDPTSGQLTNTTYHVKTHDCGGTKSGGLGLEKPSLEEPFCYKLLELIGVGGEAYFIPPEATRSQTVIYIATKGIPEFVEFRKVENYNSAAMAELLCLQELLLLRDLSLRNCGQGKDGRLLVVDFSVPSNSSRVAVLSKEGLLTKLKGSLDWPSSSAPALILATYSTEERLAAIGAALVKWDIPRHLNTAKRLVEEALRGHMEKHGLQLKGNSPWRLLSNYMEGIRDRIEMLNDLLSEHISKP